MIRFQIIEEIDKNMPLFILPKPDSVIRVLMEYKPLNKYIEIKEQQLVTPKRIGLVAVEWGGKKI